jgi:hypothetical protein
VIKKEYTGQQFLNVDAHTNDALIAMIDLSDPEFDFEGYSKFVINASELCNGDLHEILYSYPTNLPQTVIQNAK